MSGLVDLLVNADVKQTVEGGDNAVHQALNGKKRIPPAAWLEPMGGIAGAEASFPTSAPEIIRRLTDRYGGAAVRRLRAADARVLRAVRDARQVRKLLGDAQGRLPFRTHQVAFLALQRQIDAHQLDYHDVLSALAIGDDGRPAGRLDDTSPPVTALATLGEMLWDTAYARPEQRAAALEKDAQSAQDVADWRVGVGAQLVGRVVARLDADDLTAASVLPPVAGGTDEDLAVAAARLTGVATAIVRIFNFPSLFYAYALSSDVTYSTALSTGSMAGTDLHTAGNLDVVALTTSEGHVLHADRNGRYWVVQGMPYAAPYLSSDYPAHDPAPYVGGDLQLAELEARGIDEREGDVYEPDLPLLALFAQTALDYTIARLARAQQSLILQYRKFRPPDSPDPVSPAAGAALKTRTADLRHAMYQAAALAASISGRLPTDAERKLAAERTAAMGRIVAQEPLALVFVRVDLDPASDEPPTEDKFVNLLDGLQDGDAALRAMAELNTRLDNIDKVRSHLLAHHPEAARGLAPVHPEVMEAFTERQRSVMGLLELVEGLHDAVHALAVATGMGALGLIPLMFVGSPIALVAAGISAAIGVASVPESFQQAEALAAMAELDVPGGLESPHGFQLASADDAASARRWAWIGYGLSVIDLWCLRADFGRLLRTAATGVPGTTAATAAFVPEAAVPLAPMPRMAAATGIGPALGLAVAVEAAELANKERLSTLAFKQLAREMRVPQRSLRTLIMAAVDEARREAAITSLRRAAAELLAGGSAERVEIKAVLKPPVPATPPAVFASSRAREFLIVGGGEHELGWGVEQLAAGRPSTAVAPTRTADVDAFVAARGRFVQGTIADLPAGYTCNVAREELLATAALPDVDAFVGARVERLRHGGQWVVVTESKDVATKLTSAPPRNGARLWSTEYTTFREGSQVSRYVVVIAKPRPTTMTALASLARPATMTEARLTAMLAELAKPENAARLRRKLADMWHQGMVEAGEIAEWRLKNFTGNIAEILADDYKVAVKEARQVTEPGATLHTGVRRIDGATGASREFTDDLIVVEQGGNVHVRDVFEIKAGPRGGQEAVSQLFEWMENELQEGDRIVLHGREWVYAPGSTAKGRIVDLASAQRHIVVAKGAETAGRRTADVVAAPVGWHTLRFGTTDVNAADIRYLARRIVESLPPAP